MSSDNQIEKPQNIARGKYAALLSLNEPKLARTQATKRRKSTYDKFSEARPTRQVRPSFEPDLYR